MHGDSLMVRLLVHSAGSHDEVSELPECQLKVLSVSYATRELHVEGLACSSLSQSTGVRGKHPPRTPETTSQDHSHSPWT